MTNKIPPPPNAFYKFLVFLLYMVAVVFITMRSIEYNSSPLWPIVILTLALFFTLLVMGDNPRGSGE